MGQPTNSRQKQISQLLSKIPHFNQLLFPDQDQEYDFNFDTLYKIKVLGQGQSIVAKYLHEPSNKFIAIKSIIVPRSRYRGINIESLCSIIEEIEILKILEHSEYVINYYGCGYDGDFLHLCLESMDESLQGLYKKMSDIPGFNYGHGILLENVAIAITNALVDCERNKIAHCDIKPGNILINASGQIKLSDFGEACILHRLKGPKGGTIFYWPPEKLAYGDADTQYEVGDYSQADVWALGMTLIECIYHSNPILMESHATGIEDFANIQKYILELDVDEFTGSKKDDFDMGGLLPSDSFPKLFVGSKMAKFIRRCLSRVPIRPKFNELLITQEYRDLIINPPFVSDFLIKVKKWFIQYYEIRTGDIKFPDDDRIYEFNLNDFEDKTPKYFEFHFHYREPLNSVKLLSQPQERYLHKPSNKELYFKRNVYTGHLNYNFYDEVQFLREFNDHTNIIKMYSNGFFSDFNGNGTPYVCLELMDLNIWELREFYRRKFLFFEYYSFPERIIGHIAVMLTKILIDIHEKGYRHGNLKPTDILLNKNGDVKLSNFEYSWQLSYLNGILADQCYRMGPVFSTKLGIPPERLNNIPTDSMKADVWTLGITLLLIISQRSLTLMNETTSPFSPQICNVKCPRHFQENCDDCLKKPHWNELQIIKFNLLFGYSRHMRGFIEECLKEMDERPTFEKLLKSKFIEKHQYSYEEDRLFLKNEIQKFFNSLKAEDDSIAGGEKKRRFVQRLYHSH